MATSAEIAVSYDVGNDFFRLWLDCSMNYSCAVWEDGDNLDQAQERKLDFLHGLTRIDERSRVLDIGCGWGANLARLSGHRGVAAAHGLTMSAAQAEEIVAREIPRATVDMIDYRDYSPAEPFDAVISIEMFEQIATPQQEMRGEHMQVFRHFFRQVHRWTRPGAWFALQTATLNRLPRRSDHIRDMAEVTRDVLPGSRAGRLDEIVQACGVWWEVREVITRRADYVRTCQEWRSRLRAAEAEIRRRWGDRTYQEYDRYLRTGVWFFDLNYLSLAQLALRRIDD
ncbi:MAG: class I SAM-dependent methyltransferase [Pseudonocardiaceae bacterium]